MASCIHAVIQKDLVSELRMILRRYLTPKYLPVDIFTNKKVKHFNLNSLSLVKDFSNVFPTLIFQLYGIGVQPRRAFAL